MRRAISIYLTPIVLVLWAAFIEITGENPVPVILVAIAVSVAIQTRALICKYKDGP